MAKAMIRCDECGAILDPKGLKNKHRTEGDLEITFFQCGRCGKEYIGFITDSDLREDVKKVHRQNALVRLMKQKKMTKKSIQKEEAKLERMRRRALKREQELKTAYQSGGDGHGQADKAGTETGDPEGVQNPSDCGVPSAEVSGRDPGNPDPKNGLEQNAGNVLLFRAPDAGSSE